MTKNMYTVAGDGPCNEELALRMQAGDKNAAERLVSQNEGYLTDLARAYTPRCEMEDLKQEAALALLDAAGRFDPAYGTKLLTYATPAIEAALSDYASRYAFPLSVPTSRGSQLRTVVHLCAEAQDASESELTKAVCEKLKICISVRRERKTEQPPRLFDLTGLQREGNRIYGYTAKQTLDLAQALYEKRLLTYPRTDSNYLTDDMGDTAVHIAALLVGKLPFMKGAAFTPDISKCERKTMGSLHRRRFILSQERLSVGAVGQYCEGNRKEVNTIGAA